MSEDETTVLFTSGGSDNPYHRLLFDALEDNGVEPIQEPHPIFLPLTRAVFRNEDIDAIHMDWLYSFFMVFEFTPSTILNSIITVGRAAWFCVDLLLVKMLGVQLVWTVHNKYHHERYYHRTERVLNVVFANLVDRLTVKCESAKETISDIYWVRDDSKIAVIPDGHYMDAYPNKVGREEARSWLNVGDKFVYLYFGKIRPYKGVEQLIEAFQSVDDQEATLWVVGNPKTEKLEADIRSLAEQDERIHTRFQYIPEEEVQYYMNAADVLVFPYREILNSGSVYLGLSFGKLIVAPEMGCIPSVLPAEHNLLYDPHIKTALRDTVIKAKDEVNRNAGKANRRTAKNHSWNLAAQSYKNKYSF